ncbi:nucleotidyltransferase domain-containing protein [Candidatus Pacearchaeota archaeon]|nr:nucleotidyltransferase domain-containing protein [Candidatus Pacearchaeota archaeon]
MKKSTIKNNDVESLKESDALLKTLFWFFAFPDKEVSLNDLSRNIGVSKTTCSKIVLNLVEEGFLKKENLGKVWRISCNVNHPYNSTVKIPHNLSIIYRSGIVEHVYKLIPEAKSIILFGSYRKGDDTSQSDLDIAVEVVGDKSPEIMNIGNLDQLGYRKNVPVRLFVFSRNKVDLNVFANIANGIVLSGFLEVRI